MSAFRPKASWITTTPGHGPGEPTGTARYDADSPTVTSGIVFFPLASGPPLRRRLPSSLLRRSSVQAAPRPFGSRGSRLRRGGSARSYLAPAGHPGAAGHRVVAEQGRRLRPHQLADLPEHQADLLLGPLVGPRLDGVPQGADVRRPHQPGGQALGREPAHERGLGLLLVHLGVVVIQPEVPGHPLLELLELGQQRGRPLHQLRILACPVGKPERQLIEPDVTQRLLRNRRPRPVANHFVGHHARYVVQHEREADVLEHRAMLLPQDVAKVFVLVIADLADVRVEPRLPGAVAHLPRELGEVLRVVAELVAVDPLQPALTAHLAEVGGHRVVVDLRPGDQENLGFYAPHGTAHYSGPAAFTRARHRSRTLAMIWCPDRPAAVRIDSGWNCTAHRPASSSSIAITTSAPSGDRRDAVTANPPRTSLAGAYRLWYRPAVNSPGSPDSSELPDARTSPGLPCAGSGSRDSVPPACSTMACRPRQTPKVGRCRAYTSSSSAAQPKSAGRPGPGDMTTRSGA